MHRYIQFLLFALILVFILMGLMLYIEPLPNAVGSIDSMYNSLLVSGAPITQNSTLKWVAWLFGICILSIFLVCVYIGAYNRNIQLNKTIIKSLSIGAALYIMVYILMVNSWWSYTDINSFDYFLGLPKPTAWMMFGLLFCPFFLSYFYIFKFDDWIYNPEDDAKFQEILKNRKSKEHQ